MQGAWRNRAIRGESQLGRGSDIAWSNVYGVYVMMVVAVPRKADTLLHTSTLTFFLMKKQGIAR